LAEDIKMTEDNSLPQRKYLEDPSSIIFNGRGPEYFRIWITNVFLTIITLGIYSAWASVRTKKYFYNNTQLLGQSFDFHAKPMQILKGRLIAVAIYILYTLISKASPMIAGVLLILFYIFLPALVLLSLQFRLSNTSYRGIRFSFQGKTKDAYITFLMIPVLTFVSLGMLLPYFSYKSWKYWLLGIQYGKEKFETNIQSKIFYWIYLKLLSLLVLASLLIFTPLYFFDGWFRENVLPLLPLVIIFIMLFFVGPFLGSNIGNYTYGNTNIGPVFFKSNLDFKSLAWLRFTNFLLIILSLGIFMPFAKVRSAHYFASRLSILNGEQVDEFLSGVSKNASAVGDEVANIFDVDVPAI
jgi:uncharacterized membrane protein YjgN (DUF898 family)